MDKIEESMKELGISTTEKTYYLYKNHRYENLKDAIYYAEIQRDLAARQKQRGGR